MKKFEFQNKLDNPNCYEHYEWQKADLSAHLKGKLNKIFAMIPADVKTIIDIGCGDGTITNQLAQKYDVTGVDRSKNALRYLKTRSILSSADHIDVPDQSFDMVFSSELLEHLDDQVLHGTIREMKRISKKYIFLTVPNNETIEKDLIQCPECRYIFQRSYHLRNLNLPKIQTFFPEYCVIQNIQFGGRKRGYHPFLNRIKHKWVPPTSWIPKLWTRAKSWESICPNCEMRFTYTYRFHLLGALCDILNMFLSPHKPYWLFIVMRKIEKAVVEHKD